MEIYTYDIYKSNVYNYVYKYIYKFMYISIFTRNLNISASGS